jgi:nucleoside-diphosphate-sugar epimerase
LELSSKFSIKAFIHAGSSSEYGLNCAAPTEDAPLQPNSHYAVTKAAAAQMIKFYGTIKEMPVLNLRYYSIYGPFEEPDRLIPQLIDKGMKGTYPPLVQPDISRDFVYIDDTIYATLLSANSDFQKTRGKSINIASGAKTTIREIANTIKNVFNLSNEPEWGDFPNRKWDLKDWYGNAALAKELLGWQNETSLKDGLTLLTCGKKTMQSHCTKRRLYKIKSGINYRL